MNCITLIEQSRIAMNHFKNYWILMMMMRLAVTSVEPSFSQIQSHIWSWEISKFGLTDHFNIITVSPTTLPRRCETYFNDQVSVDILTQWL